MAADWQMIRLDKEGPVAIVSLTNPPLNVLHPQMVEELAACFAGLADDPEVLVAIITGDGERAFCAGFDIKGISRPPETRPGGEAGPAAARQPGRHREPGQADDRSRQRLGAGRRHGSEHGLRRAHRGGECADGTAGNQAGPAAGRRRHATIAASGRRRHRQGDHVHGRPDRRGGGAPHRPGESRGAGRRGAVRRQGNGPSA